MMNNQTAHYLRTLFDLGSISRAADALGISQPSLTQYIQRIENEWHVEIIDRSTRPFRPTEEGLMILKTEQAVAELRNNCHQALIDFSKGVRGHIRIGVSEYREIFFLTDVLPVFKARFPLVEISLIEGTTDQLETFPVMVLQTSLLRLRQPIKIIFLSMNSLSKSTYWLFPQIVRSLKVLNLKRMLMVFPYFLLNAWTINLS